ncbi:serine/threonine-protein kinase [Streptomyces yangpuensis]|uniref:serine/threonine-protein kinase n=1 Tax=Streptomyces yangpuensis TaxID=1648182 RepID=UPI00380D2CF3
MDMGSHGVRAGERVGGRFELVEPIGKGGMAQVWRAVDAAAGREVAVKFLRLDSEDLHQLDAEERLAELDMLRGRFRREATLLGRLDHPGIPELFGHGTHQDTPYIAMRLVTGVTLHDFLKTHRPVPLSVAASAAAQAADALACAHTHPLVHRDLKPQNIMISDDGIGTLLDFGIARPLVSGVTRYTPYGSSLGSHGYQAPEQILGKEPTTLTDIYSFGCVCYQLFAGRAPFVPAGTKGMLEQHLYDEPLPLGMFAVGVPEALDDLVLRMLSKDQQRRPGVEEVLKGLEPFTPRPGDPEPRPRMRPDPTAPFRLADRAQDPRPAASTPAAPVMDEEWLDVRAVEQLCEEAEREIHDGDPDDAIRRLSGLAQRARREWGSRRPLVRRVWELVAEGLRVAGDCAAAARLYQGIADELIRGDGPQERADRTVLRLRTAECRLAFGEIEAAIEAVRDAGYVAAGLPAELAAHVEEVRREVNVDITERLFKGGPTRP